MPAMRRRTRADFAGMRREVAESAFLQDVQAAIATSSAGNLVTWERQSSAPAPCFPVSNTPIAHAGGLMVRVWAAPVAVFTIFVAVGPVADGQTRRDFTPCVPTTTCWP